MLTDLARRLHRLHRATSPFTAPGGRKDRSAVVGPAVRARTGPLRPGSAARDASIVTAAMPVTTLLS